MKQFWQENIHNISIVILIIFFIGISAASALSESLTYDEPVHIQSGFETLSGKTYGTDPYNPPLVSKLAVVPLLLNIRLPGTQPNYTYFFSRMVIVCMGAVLIWTVYTYAGFVAAFLLAFEPTFLAHSHYIKFDVPTAFFIFLFFLFSNKKKTLTGIIAGLALSVRVMSLPILLFMGLLRHGVLVLSIAFFVVWSTYFFHLAPVITGPERAGRVSSRLSENRFVSPFISLLKTTPVPLGDYLAIVKNNALRSSINTQWFFNGKYTTNYAWYFLPLTLWWKLSPLLIFGCLIGLFYSKKELIPVCIILGILIITKTSPLIRYALPVIPFLCIIAARGFSALARKTSWMVFPILLLLYTGDSLRYFPHFIAYASPVAGARSTNYRRLADSNLDWGQGLVSLFSYIKKVEPRAIEFSYFGQDAAALYGFPSTKTYTSWISTDVCAFHHVVYPQYREKPLTIISVTNWYGCGYNTSEQYQENNIAAYIADSFLIFK